jgi:hypothetical protein
MGEGRRASEGGQRAREGDEGGNDQEDISNEKRNERRQTLPLLERVVRERTESTLAPSVTIPKVPQRPPRRTQ